MRRTLLAILLALALVAIPVGSALADNTAGVTVTATPGWVSITVAPTDYDFAVVTAGSTPDTTAGAGFTITNDSTVNMDVTIECDGWTGAPTNSWTYADTPGANTGSLNFSTTGGAPWTFIPETPTTASLATNVPTTTDPTFDLQLEAPTSFTYVDVQTTTVTLTAAPTP